MFNFSIRGKVVGMAQTKDGQTVVRIVPEGMQIQRADGQPSHVGVRCTGDAPRVCIGDVVECDGAATVESHRWTKREFGKEKSRDIVDYYFQSREVRLAVKKASA